MAPRRRVAGRAVVAPLPHLQLGTSGAEPFLAAMPLKQVLIIATPKPIAPNVRIAF